MKPGLYRHYKGGLYRALFLLTHHESSKMYIAYVPYQHPESGIMIREYDSPEAASWCDKVGWPKKNKEHYINPESCKTVTQVCRFDLVE